MKNIHSLSVVLLQALILSAWPVQSTASTDVLVGTIEGTAGVSPTGSSTYLIPIAVPSAEYGFAPSINLVYNSHAGDQIAGYGWSISGISSISRCGKNHYFDGESAEVTLSTSDNLVLDGQRLLLASGSNLSEGATYYPECDPKTKIVYHTVNSIKGFSVYHADGSVSEYGLQANSSLGQNNSKWLWLLNKTTDLRGRTITYSYSITSSNAACINSISYESNKSIQFSYEPRTQTYPYYFAGNYICQTKRLTSITSYVRGNRLNEYRFSYDESGLYPKLTDITLYGSDGNTHYNPTHFIYDGQTSGNEEFVQYYPRRVGQRIHYGDVDGDGRTDIVSLPLKEHYAATDYLYAYLSKSINGHFTFVLTDSIQLGTAFHDVMMRDMNGDGICDILLFWASGSQGLHRYYSCVNGSLSIQGTTYTPWGGFDVGDYDGDGKADFLNRVDDHIYNLSGNVIATATDLDWNYYITHDRFIPSQKILCDVNGNGKEDLLVLKDDLRVYEVRGNAVTEIVSFRNSSLSQGYVLAIGDYNGDGYTDIIAQKNNSSGTYDAKLYLSTGQIFLLASTFTVSNPVRVGDFNKDRKCDIFYRSDDNENVIYNIGISHGNGFDFSSSQSAYLHTSDFSGNNNIELLYSMADFDGDGMDEFGLFQNENMAVIKNFPNSEKLALWHVTDGLGKAVTYYYSTSSVQSVCTFSQDTYYYPLARPSKPLELVSCMDISCGQTLFRTNYSYQNPIIHVTGKGFLGFAGSASSDDTREIVSITSNSFRPPYYYPYVCETLTKTFAGDSISKIYKQFGYNANSTIHPKAFVPYLQTHEDYDFLHDMFVGRAAYAVDNYGNPTDIRTQYSGWITDKEDITYENTTSSKWVIGQPVSITKYKYNQSSHTKEKQVIQYDPDSRLVKKIINYRGLQDGKVSEEDFTYSYGNIATHSIKHYDSTTALTTTYGYTYGYNNLSSVTDPFQQQTTYTYNGKDQRIGMTFPDGRSVSYTYDVMGRLITEAGNDTTSVTTDWQWDSTVAGAVYCETVIEADGTTNKIWRDADGREIRNSTLRFDGSEMKTDLVYNEKGQLWKVSQPYKTGNTSHWDIYTYIDDGRLSSVGYASGSTTVYDYDGKNTTVTTDGIAVTKTVNDRGELIKVSDPKGNIIYTLRPDGQPQKIEALGITTQFGYDSFDRQTSINDPSAGLRSVTYNENGQLFSETDSDGRTVTYTYDTYGRLSDKVRPEMTTHYNYDNKNRLVCISSNNGTSEVLTYDALGRIASGMTVMPNNRYLKREYTYHLGNVSATKYSNQTSTLGTERFVYANGYLKTITFGNDSVWKLKDENGIGQCVKAKSGPITRRYSFTETGHPSGRMMLRGDTPLMNFGYSFDNATGNLFWRKDAIRNKTEYFGYDDINRLFSYGDNTMTYDDKGNILGKNDAGLTMGYNHSTKPYAVTSISPGFSPAVTRYSRQYIAYNSFECPDTITDNGQTCTYIYNAGGERAVMRSNSHRLPTRYYAGNFYEEEILDDTTTYRLYLGGDAYTAPAVYVKKGNTGSICYIGRDHLGSITHITDNTGNLLYEYSYDPWGRLRNPMTQQVYDVGMEPYLFLGRGYCGHEHLDWCGLINMNARLYDPTVGRFLSPDPYVQAPDFSQNFNRYSYCLNNPLRYTDISGEWMGWDDVIAMVVGGVFNLGSNLLQGNVNSFWQGLSLFGVGALAGEAALYTGGAAPYVSAGITSVGNDLVNQGFNNGSIDWWQVGSNLVMSEFMAGVTLGLSGSWSGPISTYVSKLGIKSPAINSMLSQSLVSGSVGATIDGSFTLINGGSGEDIINAALRGGGVGLTSGAVSGLAGGIRTSRSNGINPWTGKDASPQYIHLSSQSDYQDIIDCLDLQPTINRINRGDKLHYRHDGDVFYNNKNILPQVEGGYREWVVPTPTLPNYRPGPQRILTSDGMWFYTPDHYETFIRIK